MKNTKINPQHPEDRIYEIKKFINQLQAVGEQHFSDLSESLKMTPSGEDLLFDYVYNDEAPVSFEEYLEKMGKKYESCVRLKSSEKSKESKRKSVRSPL